MKVIPGWTRAQFSIVKKLTAVTEFLLLPFGIIETTQGPFPFDAQIAADVMAQYQEQFASSGKRMCFDYQHNTWGDSLDPDAGIAAGWFDLELRDDGIWVVAIEWTARALAYLEAGEYQYYSPYCWLRKGTRRMTALGNVALTNIPSFHRTVPLAYAAQFSQADQDILQSLADPGKELWPDARTVYAEALLADGRVVYYVCWELALDEISKYFAVPYLSDSAGIRLVGAPVEVERITEWRPIESLQQEAYMLSDVEKAALLAAIVVLFPDAVLVHESCAYIKAGGRDYMIPYTIDASGVVTPGAAVMIQVGDMPAAADTAAMQQQAAQFSVVSGQLGTVKAQLEALKAERAADELKLRPAITELCLHRKVFTPQTAQFMASMPTSALVSLAMSGAQAMSFSGVKPPIGTGAGAGKKATDLTGTELQSLKESDPAAYSQAIVERRNARGVRQ